MCQISRFHPKDVISRRFLLGFRGTSEEELFGRIRSVTELLQMIGLIVVDLP